MAHTSGQFAAPGRRKFLVLVPDGPGDAWPVRYVGPDQCLCGHNRSAHEHYRAATDCGCCGCPRYRRVGGRIGPLLRAAERVRDCAAAGRSRRERDTSPFRFPRER